MSRDFERRIGPGVQLFRIRHPERHFVELADLGPMNDASIAGRRVWLLEASGAFYALLTLPFEDEEEILSRAPDGDWEKWDWEALAVAAEACRWRGPDLDERWID
jgi:hypothetical protein